MTYTKVYDIISIFFVFLPDWAFINRSYIVVITWSRDDRIIDLTVSRVDVNHYLPPPIRKQFGGILWYRLRLLTVQVLDFSTMHISQPTA